MTGLHGVPALLAAALGARGFTELTEVQAAIRDLPDHTADLLVSAATGSGKTIAIGLALAPALIMARELWIGDGRPARPGALIVVPTRELARQVREELAWLFATAGLAVALCAGGTDPGTEVAALARGAAIVVATPGRFRAHLRRGTIDPGAIGQVVLDEADELLARGFRDEIERILASHPPERRLILVSATPTAGVEALARACQRGALRIDIARKATGGVAFEGIVVGAEDRDRVLGNLLCLTDPGRALVFCARRGGVAPLAAYLGDRGFKVVALSGDLAQGARDAALSALRDGRARVCVATDLAARGLDLPGLDLVIHADPPLSSEALLHRSGRTGRAGREGRVALLVPPAGRRRVEALLRRAGIGIAWRGEPEAAEVAAREGARLLASFPAETAGFAEEARGFAPAFPLDLDPDDAAEAAIEALRARGVDRLARALAQGWYAARPRFDPPVPLAVGDGPVWFRLNRGAGGQGEVRRLLPFICRLGGARRDQIGRVRVFAGETHFEVLAAAVPGFLAALHQDLGDLVLRPIRSARASGGPV